MKPVLLGLILLFSAVVAVGQDPPTLRIVTENPNLPSELYYGEVKVKPLRLRPGTTTLITFNDNDAFVQQHYVDFLRRFPEPAGFQGWMNILSNCNNEGHLGSTDPSCDRVEVSSAFYRSPEFQERGYFVYRFYDASLGRKPLYAEFTPDMNQVSGFLTSEEQEAAKVAFIQEFMNRPEFVNKYNNLGNDQYVAELLATAGLPGHPSAGTWVNALDGGSKTKAQVLREFIESSEVNNKFFNRAFVVMQYFGYLRRDPDALYQDWMTLLNETGNYRTMIFGFVYSPEYRNRY